MALHLFAGLRVRDFGAAQPWYERLLGQATFLPHAIEAVWTLAEDRSVYVVEHADGAGTSVVTVFVDDLDAQVSAIAARGLQPDKHETYSNGVRKVIYHDPDGNEIGFGGGSWMTDYTRDHRQPGERARLALMSKLLGGGPMHRRYIDAMGVVPGTQALEVGWGNGSISAWLGERASPGGRVVALDIDLSLATPRGGRSRSRSQRFMRR